MWNIQSTVSNLIICRGKRFPRLLNSESRKWIPSAKMVSVDSEPTSVAKSFVEITFSEKFSRVKLRDLNSLESNLFELHSLPIMASGSWALQAMSQICNLNKSSQKEKSQLPVEVPCHFAESHLSERHMIGSISYHQREDLSLSLSLFLAIFLSLSLSFTLT